jgi:hypothetical protein
MVLLALPSLDERISDGAQGDGGRAMARRAMAKMQRMGQAL